MLTASVSRKFDIPVDGLWDLIGDFGNMAKWTGAKPESCVQEGQGIGSLRKLTLADGRVIVDRLEALGPRSYTYSIVTSPLPYESYRATMQVAAVDEASSELTWTGEFEPLGSPTTKPSQRQKACTTTASASWTRASRDSKDNAAPGDRAAAGRWLESGAPSHRLRPVVSTAGRRMRISPDARFFSAAATIASPTRVRFEGSCASMTIAALTAPE